MERSDRLSSMTPGRPYRAPMLWIAQLIMLAAGFRVFADIPFTFVQLFDEAAAVALGTAFFILCTRMSRRVSFAVLCLTGLLLAAFYASNIAFFVFFRGYLEASTLESWSILLGVRSSIASLLSEKSVLAMVALSYLLAVLSALEVVRRRSALRRISVSALSVLAALLILVGSAVRSDPSIITEENPLLYMARQSIRDVYLSRFFVKQRKEKIVQSYRNVYNTHLDPATTWRASPAYPLQSITQRAPEREPADPLPNVVLILLESIRGYEAGIDRPTSPLMPNLHEVAREGLRFPNVYFNGNRTIRGELSVLCSILPYFGGRHVYTHFSDVSARCLPEILRSRGYSTSWISSFDASFSNAKEFLAGHGIDDFFDRSALIERGLGEPQVGMGPSDENLYRLALEVLDSRKEPFFAEILTLSNHHPWSFDFPVEPPGHLLEGFSGIYANYRRGIFYSDYALGTFLREAKERPWFKNTVFIFLGDHGVWYFPEQLDDQPPSTIQQLEMFFRAALVIWSPAMIESRTVSAVGSQIDIAPTLLHLLRLDVESSFQGVSLLADIPEDRRFALLLNENVWSIRQGNRYCYAAGASCFITMPPYCTQGRSPSDLGRSCFETSADLLSSGTSAAELTLLEPAVAEALVERAASLVDGNNLLLQLDAIYPRAAKNP